MSPLLAPVLLAWTAAAGAEDFVGGPARRELAEAEARGQGLGAPQDAQDCTAQGTLGCYLPPSGPAGGPTSLLVYFRGHWRGNGAGRVPEGRRLASARQALSFYGLRAAAASVGAAVLVTGSSDVGVAEKDLAALEAASGVRFERLFLAAHSGGYVGLLKSLPGLRRPERIVMLDDFYFTDPAAARLIQERVAAGAVCAGFLTAHNLERWRTAFEPHVRCAVERHDDLGHDGGVNACLGAYLSKTTCP